MQAKENYRIRLAEPSDLSAMLELLKQLFAIEADFHFDAGRQRQGLQHLLAHELGEVLIAEQQGSVVGMCTMQRFISTAEGGWAGFVEDVVVARDHRGRGIGSQLLATMQRRAKAWGISRLQLLVDSENAPALAFYAKQGWRPTQLVALRKQEWD